MAIASSAALVVPACSPSENKEAAEQTSAQADTFTYLADQFADLAVLRYQVPNFEQLSPQQKELAYYLYEAALAGRDIIWDQNYQHNLLIRKTLEAILETYKGEKSGADWQAFLVYAKRVFFSNGIHHHYSMKKIMPQFSEAYWQTLLNGSDKNLLPASPDGQSLEAFLKPILFDPNIAAKRVNLDSKDDLIATSANNFYQGLTQKEVEAYYKKITDPKDPTPVSYGLNSQLVKGKNGPEEKVWKVGGMYGPAIEKMVFWLEKAAAVAENPQQQKVLNLLVEYYKTGSLKKFDEYSIEWVKDTQSMLDVVNGFIETYGDPLSYKGSFESVVSFKDMEATKRIAAIGAQAQWFEDNSPIKPEHKKKEVKGIEAKVITVVVESGDAGVSTPIGINLPNANWIRQNHGSKSVSLSNIVSAYDNVRAGSGTLEEFCFDEQEIQRAKKFGVLAGHLHTDMHEVIGHASGQILPGVGTPKETLKNYASTLEEARADLVALYYITDKKLVDIGVMPSLEVGMAEYDAYIRNGLMLQLTRLEEGEDLEEAHMRNRQIVAKWVYEKGMEQQVITKETKDGKTYFKVREYQKLRDLFGQLLNEIQRIISEGDYKAGSELVENYGVKVDPALHKEVKERYARLKTPPYMGFIQPKLVPVKEGEKITDVKVEYPRDFLKQMLEFGKQYGHLPIKN